MKKKKIFIIFFLIIEFFTAVYGNSHAQYTIKTDEGYTIEVKLNYEKMVIADETIEIAIEVKNISGPLILICRAFIDEKFEKTPKCIKIIENPRFKSEMNNNRQILTGKISITMTDCQNKTINVPIFISGVYSGCDGGCENFLEGPFICSIQTGVSKKENYYWYIIIPLFLCAMFTLIFLLRNKKKKL